MLAILAPLIVFGLVIFVHELGHFIAAKLTGVYAPRFSIGFGPALFRRRRGETEYVLAALPLGGYVRMASRHDSETSFIEGGGEDASDALKPGEQGYDPDAMLPFGPKPVPEHRWFESKSLAARLFIMIAGVTMNMLLAFIVYSGVYIGYGIPIVATRTIGVVHPLASAPSLAGLAPGDTIVAVNGVRVADWEQIAEQIASAPAGTLNVRTNRSTVAIPIGSAGAPSATDLLQAIEFRIPAVIGEVLPGSAARKAGVQVGDTIVAIAGQPVSTWQELVRRVGPAPDSTLAFRIKRGAQTLDLSIRTQSVTERDSATKQARQVGKIGAAVASYVSRQPLPFGQGLSAGARQTLHATSQIGDVLKRLFTRQISVKELGGPIAITRQSVAAGQDGLLSIIMLIAFLSVNVAVLNLLPIPILDGGQILINIAESVKGSAFSMRTREYILRIGLAAILLIFVVATYNDVVRLIRDFGGRLFG
jgi:regulator of sigma E protease